MSEEHWTLQISERHQAYAQSRIGSGQFEA